MSASGIAAIAFLAVLLMLVLRGIRGGAPERRNGPDDSAGGDGSGIGGD